MNVVYDLSFFGVAEKFPVARAGIYRVVESLARVLMDSDRCSIRFSAFEGNFYNYVLRHLSTSLEYKSIYLPHIPRSTPHYQLNDLFFQMDSRASASSGTKKGAWTALRKLTCFSRNIFSRNLEHELSLQNADIFHSPFYAIPQRIRKHKNVNPFLTVYDLIPVLHPEFFEAAKVGSAHPVKTIIDGIRREDRVLCISQSTMDDLCNYRKDLDPLQVFVTPLGASKWFYPCKVDAAIEAVRLKYRIPPGRYVLSLCTFEPRKNLAQLISCFVQLIQQEKLTDLRLVLVGNLGWKYEAIFAELASAKALQDRIVITGFVADEDLAALYSGSLFFAYPSFYEGFGLPPLEAMQCGVPVITSNTSSLPEVVGDAGLMVAPRDTDGWCQAMLRLGSESGMRETMAQKSLEQAKRFSWDECASQTLNAYQTAISGSHS